MPTRSAWRTVSAFGRQDEIGSLQAGKLADVGLWRIDDLGAVGHRRSGVRHRSRAAGNLQLLLVGGSVVVEAGAGSTANRWRDIPADSARELARRAGVSSAG